MVRGKQNRCSLDSVTRGAVAEVVEIAGVHTGTQQLAHRGIRPGARLRVKEVAPLGGPVMVEVGGAVVAIGRALARDVTVLLVEEARD